MNHSENIALQYLKYVGFSRITYEPRGRSTAPDFLVDESIAVEVREMGQHILGVEGRPCALKKVDNPVEATLARILASLGPPQNGVSWGVAIDYDSQVPGRRQVDKAVRQCLQSFMDNDDTRSRIKFRLFDNFELELFRLGDQHSHRFVWALAATMIPAAW